MSEKLTIYEIKRRTAQTEPYFFSPKTMKAFGQTLADFKVQKQNDGTYLISAPSRQQGKVMGYTERIFNPADNTLRHKADRVI